MKSLQKELEIKGIKPSFHRLKILEYLRANPTHPTVDKIYKELSKKLPTLSKTTIYNTLGLFCEKQVVQCFNLSGNEVQYDGDISHHAHLLCEGCGRIIDIKDFKCPVIKKEMEGHKINSGKIYLMGVCKRCRKEDC